MVASRAGCTGGHTGSDHRRDDHRRHGGIGLECVQRGVLRFVAGGRGEFQLDGLLHSGDQREFIQQQNRHGGVPLHIHRPSYSDGWYVQRPRQWMYYQCIGHRNDGDHHGESKQQPVLHGSDRAVICSQWHHQLQHPGCDCRLIVQRGHSGRHNRSQPFLGANPDRHGRLEWPGHHDGHDGVRGGRFDHQHPPIHLHRTRGQHLRLGLVDHPDDSHRMDSAHHDQYDDDHRNLHAQHIVNHRSGHHRSSSVCLRHQLHHQLRQDR